MKQLITVTILIIVLIILSIYAHSYLTSSSNFLVEKIDNICVYSKNNDWSNAVKFCNESSEMWKKTKTTWAIITEHEEIDMIESSFTKLKANVNAKDLNEILVEGSNLKLLLNHIPHKYTLSVENIF